MKFKQLPIGTLLLALCLSAYAGEADVLGATARCNTASVCSFSVTVQHADEGWDHYANQWDVLDAEGNVLGERVLLHPHENEQPFTRSLSGVKIPPGLQQVTIRAQDSVHGYGGQEIVVKLPK